MTKKNFNRALFAFAVIAFILHMYKMNRYDKAQKALQQTQEQPKTEP